MYIYIYDICTVYHDISPSLFFPIVFDLASIVSFRPFVPHLSGKDVAHGLGPRAVALHPVHAMRRIGGVGKSNAS